MKLSTVFSQLTYGELSQIALGGNAQGQINETNYEMVLAHINLGLLALYKRFPLKEGRLTLINTGNLVYSLDSKYSLSNTTSTETKHIDDTDNPFLDDVLKIEKVINTDGYEFSLNDDNDPNSLFTPSATMLRVPSRVDPTLLTDTFEVVYRATHPEISTGGEAFNPAMVELELPITHLEPLLLFVASRINNPIGMVNEFNAGNNYNAKYEYACQLLERDNLKVDQLAQHDRFKINGWV